MFTLASTAPVHHRLLKRMIQDEALEAGKANGHGAVQHRRETMRFIYDIVLPILAGSAIGLVYLGLVFTGKYVVDKFRGK